MKKLVLLLSALPLAAYANGTAIPSTASAPTIKETKATPKSFTGIYIGLHGGHGTGTSHNKHFLASSHLGLKGLLGGVHLGFQKDFSTVIAGIEVSGALSQTKHKGKTDIFQTTAKTSFKRKNAFGGALKLGVNLNDWHVYAKAGYENAKFTHSGAIGADSASKSKRLHAFVPGLGFETFVDTNVLLGAEWTYTLYAKKNFGDNDLRIHHRAKIGDAKLRLSYKF
jgi:opacity protein-like surface antigen